MNTYNINSQEFKNSETYKKFISENPSSGYLKIRAYAASQAVPISGVNIVISKIVGNNNIIFYEGTTDESGVIEKITLPTPSINTDNMLAPSSISYELKATYEKDNIKINYNINMYENIYTIQTINIVPGMNGGI